MDDDSDEPSSSSSPPETLDQFREKWQQELSTTKRNKENENINKKTIACKEQNNESNDEVMIHINMTRIPFIYIL